MPPKSQRENENLMERSISSLYPYARHALPAVHQVRMKRKANMYRLGMIEYSKLPKTKREQKKQKREKEKERAGRLEVEYEAVLL